MKKYKILIFWSNLFLIQTNIVESSYGVVMSQTVVSTTKTLCDTSYSDKRACTSAVALKRCNKKRTGRRTQKKTSRNCGLRFSVNRKYLFVCEMCNWKLIA
jgi:hypothetical protein